MEIVKDLPFKFCDFCTEFVLDVEEQVLFSFEKTGHRVLTVRCRNERLCNRLKDMRKESEENE